MHFKAKEYKYSPISVAITPLLYRSFKKNFFLIHTIPLSQVHFKFCSGLLIHKANAAYNNYDVIDEGEEEMMTAQSKLTKLKYKHVILDPLFH